MGVATYNLGPVALIPLGEGQMFDAGGVTLALFRGRDGRIFATEPWCPHRGGPLADGMVASGRVLCPLHGYAFDLATGQPIHHECRALRTFPVRLNDRDEVLVTVRRRRRPAEIEDADDDTRPPADIAIAPGVTGDADVDRPRHATDDADDRDRRDAADGAPIDA
jgi:nitrite reductase (NADH) small subunit